jgi:opacity protein-like surface antigen
MNQSGRGIRLGTALAAVCAMWSSVVLGAVPDPKAAPAGKGEETSAAADNEKSELYLSLFMLGNIPGNRALKFETDPYPNTDVDGGLGGGIKVGYYPAFTGRIVGIEGEFSGFNANVDAPQSTSGGVTRSGQFRLNIFNAMANLLFRYPGQTVQPYAGAGVGLSGAFARNINLQHGAVGAINENAGDATFAYQLIGGGRINVTERLFLFSEYKYMVANYKWESELPNGAGGPSFSLPFRTHIISGGVGFSF